MSQKAHDYEAMPLCWLHHRQLHELSGHFKGWTGEQLDLWQMAQVEMCRGIYSNEGAF